jgi:hypothetical protein
MNGTYECGESTACSAARRAANQSGRWRPAHSGQVARTHSSVIASRRAASRASESFSSSGAPIASSPMRSASSRRRLTSRLLARMPLPDPSGNAGSALTCLRGTSASPAHPRSWASGIGRYAHCRGTGPVGTPQAEFCGRERGDPLNLRSPTHSTGFPASFHALMPPSRWATSRYPMACREAAPSAERPPLAQCTMILRDRSKGSW